MFRLRRMWPTMRGLSLLSSRTIGMPMVTRRVFVMVDTGNEYAAARHQRAIPATAGYYGATGTQVLFGDSLVNGSGRSGGRLIAGMWLNSCQTIGIEGEYLALGDEVTHFRDWSSGDPILSRPFFDVTRPTNDPQNVEKVAFPRGNPGSLDGSVSVDALTRFQSAGARLRFYLDSEDCCWSNPCCPGQTVHSGWQTDLLLGYRFLRLDDRLGVREELTSTDTDIPGAFLVQDQFDTENQFNGGELGLSFVMHRGRWSLEVIPKVALGSTNEIVDISGSTRTTQANGSNSVASGGLLALSSNIGHYTANEFAIVPEVGTEPGLPGIAAYAVELRLFVHLLEPRGKGWGADRFQSEP